MLDNDDDDNAITKGATFATTASEILGCPSQSNTCATTPAATGHTGSFSVRCICAAADVEGTMREGAVDTDSRSADPTGDITRNMETTTWMSFMGEKCVCATVTAGQIMSK